MILLQLNNAEKSFGDFTVFSGITWSIQEGERFGLVGANGSGKTTLLRILAGEWSPDDGGVDRPASVRVGYLPQSARVSGDRPLFEEMAALFASAPQTDPYEYKIRMALKGVGLDEPTWERATRALSGGEKCRAALAKTLLAEPDVLLLDEPTNHLDVRGREWLEAYLGRFRGAVVLVAHDRLLLDRATNRTAFLRSGRLALYPRNFRESRAMWERDVELQTKAYERQKEEIERQEDFIRRNIAGQKTKQAQSRRKMLAKLERLERPDMDQAGPGIGWQHAGRSRAELIRVESAVVGFPELPLFRTDELVLRRGEKIGMVGPNGCGKSTFLRTLLGEFAPLEGRVQLAPNTEVSYFRQEVARDHLDLTVREHFWSTVPDWEEGAVRSFLGRFLFSQDEVLKTLRALSGGERRRLELARLAVIPTHLLILDEPTNHLDIPSQEAVESALQQFEGSFLLVSHDRELLNAVCDKLWVFRDGTLREYLGNYEQYVAAISKVERKHEGGESRGARVIADKRKQRAERDRHKRRVAEAETKIAELEAQLEEIDREGRDPATATRWERLNFLATEKRKRDRELSKWLHVWDESTSALQEMEPEGGEAP